jgi:hypothetical protein
VVDACYLGLEKSNLHDTVLSGWTME